MTVYLDIVFIENVLMNYIIMFGTGLIQKVKLKNTRIIISSVIGAVYAIIAYLEIIPIYSNVIMKILLSAIMNYIAFNPQNIKKMLKSILLFYLISFATGGCALALLYLIAPQSVTFKNGMLIGTYPIKVTIIAGAIGFLIIQYSFSINKRRIKNKDFICTLKIKICGKIIETNAFIDSGNKLKDPLTNKPVVIVEKRIVDNAIDINKNYLENNKGGEIKIRIIPFKSIGKQNGILMGIQAEYIEVKFEEEKSIINDVIIGMYDKSINKNYSALVGIDLLNGGSENESNSNIKKNILQYNKR